MVLYEIVTVTFIANIIYELHVYAHIYFIPKQYYMHYILTDDLISNKI